MKQAAVFILGGMGPEASSYMYNSLIKMSIKDFGAKNNNDFPEIILHSIPVPDFISNDTAKLEALDMLKTRVKSASKLELSCLSIACNTAHLLLNELQKVTKVPFISMIDEVIKQVKSDNIEVVGILGTPVTITSKLYQLPLEKQGIKVIVPNKAQILALERIIRNVIKGEINTKDARCLIKIADSLKRKGAQAIVLGCTELPLVFPRQYSLPVYNSVEVLSKALLRIYYGGNTIRL